MQPRSMIRQIVGDYWTRKPSLSRGRGNFINK